MKIKPKKCPICAFNKSEFIITTPVQMQNCDKLYEFHRCNSCKTIFLFNPPNNSELSQYYSSEYLPYSAKNSWGKYKYFVNLGQNKIDKKRVKIANKFIKNNNINYNVLDFGCGNPTFLRALNKKKNLTCVGLDINSHGWQNKHSDFKNIKLIAGNINEINFNQKFDLITLWHALEHEFQPRDLILLFNRITNDNATLIVEVPNYHSFTRWFQKKYWGGFHTPRHSIIYTEQTLKRMLESLGWKLEKIYPYGTMDSFTLWWLGYFEKIRIKNSANEMQLEKYFWHYLFLKILSFPFFMFEKFFSFGIMLAIFKKDNEFMLK